MRLLFLFIFALAAPLTTTTGAANASLSKKSVTIESMVFSPNEFKVKLGETIEWTNKDLVPHTVTSETGAFESQTIAPGAKWTYRPRKAGVFAYKCSFHPTMSARFTVE
jgi:plastocyanin